jgi:hypothetical protein
MCWFEKWSFSLYHRPHTPGLELVMYCLSRDGCIGDIHKCLGGLSGIMDLSHANNASSIVNIGSGKLCWTTTRGFGEVGTMSRANAADGSTTEMGLERNLGSRETSIKECENMSNLAGREFMHRIRICGGLHIVITTYIHPGSKVT